MPDQIDAAWLAADEQDCAEVAARCEAATPEPWVQNGGRVDASELVAEHVGDTRRRIVTIMRDDQMRGRNLEFIARIDLPRALDARRLQRAALGEALDVIDDLLRLPPVGGVRAVAETRERALYLLRRFRPEEDKA